MELCKLDVSEDKSRILKLCHQILDPLQKEATFGMPTCYVQVCRSNDVEFARKLSLWPRLAPFYRDRCLVAALGRLYLDWASDHSVVAAVRSFKLNARNNSMQNLRGSRGFDGMLQFLAEEHKIIRLETQMAKVPLWLIDCIHACEDKVGDFGHAVLRNSSFSLKQLSIAPFEFPETLAFVLEMVHNTNSNPDVDGSEQQLGKEIVLDLMSRYERSGNKKWKRNWYPVWQQYGYSVTKWF